MLFKIKEIIINVAIGCFLTSICLALLAVCIFPIILFIRHFPIISMIILTFIFTTFTGIVLYWIGVEARKAHQNNEKLDV